MSPCIKCANLDMKAREVMTNTGFPACKKSPSGVYVSIYREIDCKHYKEASPSVIEKRIEWRNKRETCKKNRR